MREHSEPSKDHYTLPSERGMDNTFSMRVFNWVMKVLMKLGCFSHMLNAESMCREAEKITGCSDWGQQDEFREALSYLCQPDERYIHLTPAGKMLLRGNLVAALMNRLEVVDAIKKQPKIEDTPLKKPLFIVGLPRTGTTLLHNLLSLDPNGRPLLFWEAKRPAPSPDPKTYNDDTRIGEAEKGLKMLYKASPALAGIHYMQAQSPEECLALLQNTLMDPSSYFMFGDFPEYEAWRKQRSAVPAYQFYRQQLQVLQYHFDPDRHWVLKGPSHLRELEALLEVFPDACIVQTHRDPKQVVPSTISLMEATLCLTNDPRSANFSKLSSRVIAELATILERAKNAREGRAKARVFDVQYKDVMSDPVRVIKGIYHHYGYPFSQEFEANILRWLEENPQGKHGRHRYSLAQYGLSECQLKDAFLPYLSQYG